VKIIDARVTVVGTPWRELVFLELTTDDGLTGVGEVRIVNKTDTLVACIGELAPRHVLGSDPFDVERLAWNIQRAEYGRPGEVTQSALAAFDVACWDLMGQSLGVPIWKLLGGRFRDRVPAYANGWYQAEREAGAIARLAKQVVARGYRALKLDPFGAASAELPAADRRQAESIVAAVRDAVGPDVQICIEMHGRFTPATAVRVAAMLEPYDPEWIEEPVPPENAAALARVRAATRIPVATGERAHTIADIRDFVETGAADIIQVDLTHFGGFLPMKQLAGWADAHYLLLAPHNVCGPVGTAANVHFAIATPNYKVLEHFNDFADPWVFDLVDAAPRVDPADGCFALPERPGLGVRLNHHACAAHPRSGGRLKLFEAGWERRGLTT
jgi:galactonate dehydratase